MGTITGYGSKHSHEFKLTVNETSTSTANNTSEISFSFTIYKASYSWSQWNSITYNVTINGTSYTGTIPSYSAGSTMTIRSGTQTVGHNNDGTKSISYSFSVNDGSGQSYTCGNASASGTLELTKIPRYTTVYNSLRSKTINTLDINWSTTNSVDWIQYSLNGGGWTDTQSANAADWKSGHYPISGLNPNTNYTIKTRCKRRDSQLWSEAGTFNVTTYDIAKLTSTPNVNIGSAHNVTWTNSSGASTSLKLCKTDNSTIIDYGKVTGTSKSITPAASKIYPLTPNSNTYKARYIITTTANGKSYTNSKDFTFTVTNSNPNFSNFTYQDTNTTITALTGNNQILVNGYSNVKATISTANKATAKNSATMKTYKMLIGSKNTTANYSSSADVNLNLSGVTSGTIDVYATDSRGNSTKVTKNATLKNYSKIAITSLTATRTNNVGTAVTLAFKATYWNSSFGSVINAITSCIYKYKLTSASSYTNGETRLTYSISGNTITGSLSIKGDLGADGFNASNSYNIQLIISDKLSTTTSTIILGSGNPAIAVHKNNVAIGQKYDTSEGSKLQVNGYSYSKGELYTGGNVKGLPSGTDGRDYWNHLKNGIYWYGNTGAVSNMPSSYGWVWKIGFTGNGDFNVLFFTQSSGAIYRKSGNASNVSSWVRIDAIGLAGKGIKTLSGIGNTGWVNQSDGDSYLITKAFMAFWNGRYNDGSSNLTYCRQGEIQAKPKTLYNNSSGTTGTVTLSETSANFSYLEIFYRDKQGSYPGYNSVKVYAPNGKRVDTTTIQKETADTNTSFIRINTRSLTISGTSITVDNYQINYVPSSGKYRSNEQYVVRVIGYR